MNVYNEREKKYKICQAPAPEPAEDEDITQKRE